MTEAQYQKRLVLKLKRIFPGCVVLKNDANLVQGILDLTILYRDKWAMLEVKASQSSAFRPNQKYYLEELGKMSFTAAIYPENETEVLVALQEAFSSRGRSCVSQS